MGNSILERLKTECPFPEVFHDPAKGEDGLMNMPRRKIGHIRADFDGYRWWNTVWPCRPDLASRETAAEIDRTYAALTAADALKDLSALARFCETHPEACAGPQLRQAYNFYLEGETCVFWLRLIPRERDYNLYLHAFAKEETEPCGS